MCVDMIICICTCVQLMMQSIAALLLGCGKLMHSLMVTGIDWPEIRLISKLYMDQEDAVCC